VVQSVCKVISVSCSPRVAGEAPLRYFPLEFLPPSCRRTRGRITPGTLIKLPFQHMHKQTEQLHVLVTPDQTALST